jgi:hypothetical protein
MLNCKIAIRSDSLLAMEKVNDSTLVLWDILQRPPEINCRLQDLQPVKKEGVSKAVILAPDP